MIGPGAVFVFFFQFGKNQGFWGVLDHRNGLNRLPLLPKSSDSLKKVSSKGQYFNG